MRLYRALLRLYPRHFRREYGEDMVLLFEDQLRDGPATRVVGRLVLDLLVTVPTHHLEARMKRSASTPLVVSFLAVAGALAVFGGPAGIAGALVLLGLATLVLRRSRPIRTVGAPDWWKLLLAGALLLGGLVVVTTITGELPEGGWYVAMATLLASLGLIGTGVVLGVAGRARSVPGL